MSTVLTNGIIIPDNGSRNWGGDLANNWNIIDLNVGYMTDVKNKVTTLETSVTTLETSVTTLETSVAENTANIQINASNISALQTSKQDVIEDLETIRTGASSGATAVQPSTLSNYVDLSSEQTISGAKTFSNDVRISKTINAINPGALSLPNYSQYINISFAVETPIAIPENGFLSVTLNVENNSYVNVFVNDHGVYILQSALKPTVGAFIPVSANDIVKIHVADGSYTGYGYLVLYKNKGNV